jgi:hypothetical protein
MTKPHRIATTRSSATTICDRDRPSRIVRRFRVPPSALPGLLRPNSAKAMARPENPCAVTAVPALSKISRVQSCAHSQRRSSAPTEQMCHLNPCRSPGSASAWVSHLSREPPILSALTPRAEDYDTGLGSHRRTHALCANNHVSTAACTFTGIPLTPARPTTIDAPQGPSHALSRWQRCSVWRIRMIGTPTYRSPTR